MKVVVVVQTVTTTIRIVIMKLFLCLTLLYIVHHVESYHFNVFYRASRNYHNSISRLLFGTNSHIEVPPLVELILLEASEVDSSKLIEAKSIIESDTKGRDRSRYVWNAKNDALVSHFQYKIQSKDDSSIETMTLNERINELNIETYDKVDGTSISDRTSSSIDEDGNSIKKRGRPKKANKE